MDNYINDKKIITVSVSEDKTPAGNEIVVVHFEDKTTEKMPKFRFELLVSEEKLSLTDSFNKVKARIASVLFGTLHEYGVKWGEINPIIEAMGQLCDNGFQKANDIKWGCDRDDISLIDINKTLVDNAKNNSNGTTSTGSGTNKENTQ